MKVQPIKEAISRLRRSRLFRDAFWLFIFNITSKGLLFFGMANAARCLGPANLGISAQIQVLSQQLALSFNGGIDSIGLRNIALNKANAVPTLATTINFRLGTALLVSTVWVAAVICTIEPGPLRTAWMLGAPLLVIASLNTAFVFQAIGKLPLYTGIMSAGTAVAACVYLFLFRPGVVVGSDVAVAAASSGAAALAAVYFCKKLIVGEGIFHLTFQPLDWATTRALLIQGWRFWLLALVIYLYSGFPILLVSHFHGDSAAGVFRAALLMASAIELLFSSINSLLLPQLVKWNQIGTRHLWARQSHLVQWHIGIGALTGLAAVVVAPYFFERFLGAEFKSATGVFQVLVVGRVVVFIGQIYAFGLVALHMDGKFLSATLIGTAVSLSANVALIPSLGALGASLVSVGVEIIICLQYYYLERRYVFAAT